MATAVLVPWRPGCPHREAAWQWVSERYATQHPSWDVVTGSCGDGPWVKALAVEDALRRTDADRLVVADADVWCPGIAEAAERTDRPVVIPHSNVHRLTESDTRRVLGGGNRPYLTCERVKRGVAGGGIVILDRATYEQVPLDPRFVGWGQEDTSWGTALKTMTGKITRYSHPLIHLWHPPQARQSRATGSSAGRQLEMRYLNASTSPVAMDALLDEAKQSLRSHHDA